MAVGGSHERVQNVNIEPTTITRIAALMMMRNGGRFALAFIVAREIFFTVARRLSRRMAKKQATMRTAMTIRKSGDCTNDVMATA
jgi:hypothetical protein